MGRLTTHVLDTSSGKPAAGLSLRLYDADGAEPLVETRTNADGRCDAPLLEGSAFEAKIYRLEFEAGDYFDASGIVLPSPKFLDTVVLRFGVSDAEAHYHVPLLLSPYGYSTYRGS